MKEQNRTDEQRWWRAVVARDARFDQAFVYAVRSTGVYCRPSCPARRPRREQVRFFLRPEAAGRAGFRPCRRCGPQDRAARDRHSELVERVCRIIRAQSEEPLTLAGLGAQAGVSPYHLQRTFKRILGLTPKQYADTCRLGSVKERLSAGQDVAGALYEAGYGSSSRLYERAPAQLGMTPAAYRRGGRGMRIGYAIGDGAVGRVLVAATLRGICAVNLGDSDREVQAALSAEYPQAEIYPDRNGLRGRMNAVLDQLKDARSGAARLPLDIQATAFQRRVWQALRAIPPGQTRSYSQVARAIGKPRAARAVARACATNPVAIVVPCHRVVRQDGSPGGYRWGLARKRALLESEQARIQAISAKARTGKEAPRTIRRGTE